MAAGSDLESVALQYAHAAYQHTTEGWLADLRGVWERLESTPEMVERLDDTGRAFSERQAELDGVLTPDLRGDVRNFLYALLKDNHIGLLPDVIADLNRFMEGGPGMVAARVTSAVPLTAEEQAAFRQRIASRYGDRVDVEFRVDAALLGGAVVQVGDKIIDGSIAGKLNALHGRLMAAR
jgi:F-type H+-transporting ATPase subunit delta